MIYLDNGATSFPKPKTVFTAMEKAIKEGTSPGRGGHRLSMHSEDIMLSCREEIKELIKGESAERIVFTKNATEALNIAIKGSVSPGEVIISSLEHNSVLRPLVALENLGVKIKIADSNDLLNSVRSLINENTRLAVITHASNVTGEVLNIKEVYKICKEKGVLTLFDCSQSVGHIDIDANFCDMLAFPGHKGLLGPSGTGVLYVRDGIVLDTLTEGGTGSLSENALMPAFLPDRLEAGTQNFVGVAGLLEGVRFVKKEGVKEKTKTLINRLYDGLLNISGIKVYGNKDSLLMSVTFKNLDTVEASHILDENYSVFTRAGLHCAPLAHKSIGTIKSGTLRLSPGFFNTKGDIDKVLLCLNKIAK